MRSPSATACRSSVSASSGWPGTCTVQSGRVSSRATSPGDMWVRPPAGQSYEPAALTRTAPTPWCTRSSLTCSNGRSIRKLAKVCAMGRIPVSARPPAVPISSCSRMPTLITRSGCRPAAGSKPAALMSASTRARRGSSSSRRVVTSRKRSRMVSIGIPSSWRGSGDGAGRALSGMRFLTVRRSRPTGGRGRQAVMAVGPSWPTGGRGLPAVSRSWARPGRPPRAGGPGAGR